ncbi:hypothetical protein BLOT_004598 [Blomia tropicalis]|nr:hypothetical protein BLOT_004598 [Blomia tropicalis]
MSNGTQNGLNEYWPIVFYMLQYRSMKCEDSQKGLCELVVEPIYFLQLGLNWAIIRSYLLCSNYTHL